MGIPYSRAISWPGGVFHAPGTEIAHAIVHHAQEWAISVAELIGGVRRAGIVSSSE
jgi:hypothetical protein